jgi:high affinity sulfate transporter 1
LPILNWLTRYSRAWLRVDLIAGVTVAALVVPEGIAYAQLAAMPPETALYLAWIALVLYAVFGTSRQLVVGAASAVAVMSASIVGDLVPAGGAEFITLSMALAILTGVVAVLAGLLRLGRIAQFFSESVLVGFVSGLALVIGMKQAPKLFGLAAGHGNFWERLADLVSQLSAAHTLTLAVGLSSLALMLLVERRFHRIPAALAALVYGIGVVSILNLHDQGVHIVGEIPAGLAGPRLPQLDLEQWLALLPGALGVTLVVFAEAIGPVRSFAGKHRYEIDANQELVGLGMANAGAGLFQGFAVGASLSRSAANDAAGARSQVSSLVAAGLTIVVALFLTPLFHNLPEATLAAIVVVAVSGMFKLNEMRELYRVRRADFGLALVAFLGVLTFDEVLHGLLLAVIISLLALILRASQARLSVLGRAPGRLDFDDLRRHPDYLTIPELLLIRPEEGLFFANATLLREEIRDLVMRSERPITAVLVDLEMTNELDAPSAFELEELHRDLEALGARLMLSRVHAPIRAMLDRSGTVARIGDQNIFPRALEAVLEHLRQQEEGADVMLGMMGDSLRRLHKLVSGAIPRAQGEDRARLEALAERLWASIESVGELEDRPGG